MNSIPKAFSIFTILLVILIISSVSIKVQGADLNQEEMIIGADVSEILYAQQNDVVYKDRDGREADGLEILSDYGYSGARIRVNVDPPGNFEAAVDGKEGNYGLHTDQDYLIDTATAADELGMKIVLTFFYSDWWADPGHQLIPETWLDEEGEIEFEELKNNVYQHSKNTIEVLKEAGVMPEMVQIGNEIQGGILHPYGQYWSDIWEDEDQGWEKFAELLNSGIEGVKDGSGEKTAPEIIMHHHYGGDDVTWFYNQLTEEGVNWDVIGLSYYPMWHNTITGFFEDIKDVADYYGSEHDIYLIETAYYWRETEAGYWDEDWNPYYEEGPPYPQTQQGQYNYLQEIRRGLEEIETVKGIFYWGAGWTQSEKWLEAPGWDDDDAAARSLFDDNARATRGIEGLFLKE